MGKLDKLIEISRYYGENPEYVIAGGGNTSFKKDDTLWVKASGIPLAGIDENGFVSLSRKKLSLIETLKFSDDEVLREQEVRSRMKEAIISPRNLRPSVETSLHNLIDYNYVVHTHPTLVNGLMCAKNALKEVKQRFGSSALMVEYTDPGYILFKKLQERMADYRDAYGAIPHIIFLQNHGVFVGADSLDEIRELYQEINEKISEGRDLSLPSCRITTYESQYTKAISAYFSSKSLLTRSVSCNLISHFNSSLENMNKVALPFSPDIIVYCKSKYLFIRQDILENEVQGLLEQFEIQHGYYPKVILREGGGLTLVEENEKSLETVQEVYLDLMKISCLTEQFGGQHFMNPKQISFIDNWEVENYRRKVAKDRSE